MTKKDVLLNYLVDNSDSKGKIKVCINDLSKELNCTVQTIINLFKQLTSDGTIEKNKKIVSIKNKYKLKVNNITSKLNYSDREKELLTYIYNRYENRDLNYNYVCITRDNIYNNTSIKNNKHITNYIEKYIHDGLIEKIQGDWGNNKSNKYKVLFNETPIINNKEDIDKINSRIDKMAMLFKDIIEENKQLKQRVEYLESCLMNPVENKNNVSEEIIHTDGITYNPDVLFEEETTEIKEVVVNYSEEEIKAKQEEKDNFINYIHANKEKLFQNIENIDLGITGDKKKMLDKLIENGNKMNSCIEIIQECININNLLYVLPKINNNVFTQAVQYYSTDTEKIKELKQYA